MEQSYKKEFIPYALAAFLIGIVGGFSTVLGPAFIHELGIGYNNTTWTALAQAISTAAFAPILGKLGDLFGQKRTLILGIVIFTVGNILTALATSLPFMLLARFTVGMGTAAMSPVILAYIVTAFPKDRVAKGFSLYMLISSGSVIFGPSLGSLLVASRGWRWMIWLCVGICLLILPPCLLLGRSIRQRPARASGPNFLSGISVLIFFSLVLCIPSFGQNFGWSSRPFLWILGGAILSLGLLTYVQKQDPDPILPGRFMRRPVFWLSIVALFLTQGLMQANMTNLIVFVNDTQPQNSVVSGYAISVMYLGMALGAVLLGPLADRHQPRNILFGSFLLTEVGCLLLFLFSEDTPTALFMAALGTLGLGLGGNGTVFLKVVLSGLSPHEAGTVTGTYGLFRDLAAPFGVAVFVPMFTNRITANLAQNMTRSEAALGAIRHLAIAESLCVLLGIITISFLPKIKITKGEQT